MGATRSAVQVGEFRKGLQLQLLHCTAITLLVVYLAKWDFVLNTHTQAFRAKWRTRPFPSSSRGERCLLDRDLDLDLDRAHLVLGWLRERPGHPDQVIGVSTGGVRDLRSEDP